MAWGSQAYAKTLMHDAICLMAYPRLDDDELYTLTRVLQDAAKICSATIHANVDALLYSGKEFAGKPGAKRLGAAAIKPAPQQGECCVTSWVYGLVRGSLEEGLQPVGEGHKEPT